MCSVTGYIQLDNKRPSSGFISTFRKLLKASEIRGRDGFGFTTKMWGRLPFTYKVLPPNIPNYSAFNSENAGSVFISNHRAEPTTEFIRDKSINDQQPYFCRNVASVHNGTISNDKVFFNEESFTPPTKIDSYAIPYAIDKYGSKALTEKLIGSMGVLTFTDNEFIAYRNYNPLYVIKDKKENILIFSSLPELKSIFSSHDIEVMEFKPYTLMRISKNGEMLENSRHIAKNRHRGLVVCSGGLDSTTVAKIAANECGEVRLIHFKYGCKAEKAEIRSIENIAKSLKCQYEFIDMYWLKRLGGSSLTDANGIIIKGQAGAEFAHEWVPARNTAMIGIAASYADRFDCGAIYLGLNLEESGAYPDNTREFFEEFNRVLDVGTQSRPEIRNPLWSLTKKEIVKLAYEIGAPIEHAWSCYEGGDVQCGQCGPCIMRKTAHEMLNIPETVKYKV